MPKYVLTTLAPVPRLARVADGVECIRFSKQLAVLAYLVSRPQARATRDELVGLLWGEPSQADGRRALRQVVYQIRHATDHDLLRGDDVLTLRREDVEADADIFRQRVSSGAFEGALKVYEQDFLSNVALAGAREFEQWAEGVRAILAAERRQVLRTLIARESDAGRWSAAARYGEQLLAADPGSLDARLRLVELLALSGDALRARAAAEQTRVLAAETGGDAATEAVDLAVARALAPALRPERRSSAEFPRVPEMVGRATQFHSVVERWKAALDGHGGAVLLTGEAGIGKTRLSRELARRFGQDHALVLEASCYVLEQSETYGTFLEMLRQGHAAPSLGGASPGSLEILAALIPEIALRFRSAVEPRQLPILPQAVGAALLDAFGAMAREAPLALIVEDLHWAAPATIEFAHRLARHALTHPLLLVLTARDHAATPETTTALRSLAASSAVEEVALDSLDEGDVTDLLGSIAELTPDVAGCCLAEQLVEHTDGIPLYVVEVLKELHDTGYLVVQEGRWVRVDETAPGAVELPLPASGTDILRSRLRKLSPRLLHTLTALAVWGREASPATLAEVAGLEPGQAEEGEAVLERRRLVVRRDGAAFLAHEEIGAAALELSPAELVTRLHARAATLTADAAARGVPGEWMVAALHAIAAGDVAKGGLWAAHAADEAERSSGRDAGRETLRRVIVAAPGAARPQLERALARLLDGSWTARRWLDERSGTARRHRLAVAGAAVALIALTAVGTVLVTPLLPSRIRSLPLGGANIAIGWGMPGRPDSVRALTVNAAFVGQRRAAELAAGAHARGPVPQHDPARSQGRRRRLQPAGRGPRRPVPPQPGHRSHRAVRQVRRRRGPRRLAARRLGPHRAARPRDARRRVRARPAAARRRRPRDPHHLARFRGLRRRVVVPDGRQDPAAPHPRPALGGGDRGPVGPGARRHRLVRPLHQGDLVAERGTARLPARGHPRPAPRRGPAAELAHQRDVPGRRRERPRLVGRRALRGGVGGRAGAGRVRGGPRRTQRAPPRGELRGAAAPGGLDDPRLRAAAPQAERRARLAHAHRRRLPHAAGRGRGPVRGAARSGAGAVAHDRLLRRAGGRGRRRDRRSAGAAPPSSPAPASSGSTTPRTSGWMRSRRASC